MPYESVRTAVIAEFTGTFILVSAAASTSVYTHLMGMDSFTVHFYIAIVVSLAVAIFILTIGKVSGAHLNPSVSMSHAVAGLMPQRMVLPYLAAQLLAAIAAGLFLTVLCRSIHSPQYGLTKLQDGITPAEAIFLEAAGTFLLCTVAFAASTRFKHSFRKQALIVGLALFLLTVSIGPLTGASFNPSRSLGPAVASLNFEFQYVYWIGPLGGSIAACAAFLALGRYFSRSRHTIHQG